MKDFSEKKVFLKKDKEKILKQNRHPWIFSGAIESFPPGFVSGECASVYSQAGEFLAIAYFNTANSLSGRVLSFQKKAVSAIIEEKVKSAIAFRKTLFDLKQTNCFRLINGEEDGLPGLTLDIYGEAGVLQISTLGMERLRPVLLEVLRKELSLASLYEKSNSPSRVQEGLDKKEGLVYGSEVNEVIVLENGISFIVSIPDGQKTGFFLDQREMRKKIGEISKGKSFLNCFSYSGGFSLFALQGGAKDVKSVDVSGSALDLLKRNTRINGFSLHKHRLVEEDVFPFLDKEDLSVYDVIILDPPAFAKKREDVETASKGYRGINQKVFERCKKDALVLTCSCSYFMQESLFQTVLFQAATAAGKEVQILSRHIGAFDHPVSLYHPEGAYLKSFLLRIL